MPKLIDLTGKVFERLTVIKRHPDNIKGVTRWVCQCSCEEKTTVVAYGKNLQAGATRSCGCLKKEKSTKHGLCLSSEYNIWTLIKNRCYNEKYARYKDYGGRGITMSKEWKESFESFYRDMGPRPSLEHSINRLENDKGYSKDNCNWATQIEQQNNRSSNVYCEFDGEIKTLTEWCRELDLPYEKIRRRMHEGMNFEDAADDVIKNRP